VICISTLPEQLSYLGFTLSISAALCGSLVFFLRGHPEHDVRVRGFPLIPIIYVAGTLTIACLTAFREPIQALVGLATLMIGVVAYFISESAR
jgi:APA family basic amino acid/polyamine antiporter